jgi:hypothetical protein
MIITFTIDTMTIKDATDAAIRQAKASGYKTITVSKVEEAAKGKWKITLVVQV